MYTKVRIRPRKREGLFRHHIEAAKVGVEDASYGMGFLLHGHYVAIV